MKIQISELNINYETSGSGEDILLLHGWGSSLDAFAGVRRLLENNYRVTALDLPGFGKSDMPKEPWNVGNYCDLVLEFIEKLGLCNPILVGHSYGGRIILKLCGEKRVSPSKIILIAGAGVVTKKPLAVRVKQSFFKTVKCLAKCPLWSDAGEVFVDYFRRKLGSADYNSAPEVMRKTLVLSVNEDMTPILPEIEAQALLIYGDKDTATPLAQARIIEKNVKNSHLCIVKDGGHWAFVEKAQEVLVPIAEFLNIQ